MIKNHVELQKAALRGYEGDIDDAALFSSPVWCAHVAGAQLAHIGASKPAKCAMSRGYSVKIETEDGAQWLIGFSGDYLAPQTPKRTN